MSPGSSTSRSVTGANITERDIGSAGSDTTGLSIHEETYRANPEVMAVLYSRSPEIVAFTQDVPLRPEANGAAFIGNGLPVFDMSTLDPRQPVLSNPALGRGVAAALGTSEAVLLSGHSFGMTGNTIYNASDRSKDASGSTGRRPRRSTKTHLVR